MTYSIAEARNQLSRVVHEAEDGNPVELTRRGRPVAVVLSIEEYRRLRGERGDFWDAYQSWASDRAWHDPAREDPIPEEFFDVKRDPSGGRDFTW